MNLKEFEGADLFRRHGISVPKAVLIRNSAADLRKLSKFLKDNRIKEVVLKAQIEAGKRGKSGAVIVSKVSGLKKNAAALWKKTVEGLSVKEILVAERIDIKREYYLSISVNRFTRRPEIIFSREGGMDIEEIVKKKPEKIFRVRVESSGGFPESKFINKLQKAKCPKREIRFIRDTALKLFEVFIEEDCLLAEINPLVFDANGLMFAVDSKVIIDDQAVFRHPQWQKKASRSLTGLEKSAAAFGLSYVELHGDTAIIGNGAGLVMATVDMVAAGGGRPANFCDVGGGASSMMMKAAMGIVLKKKSVGKLVINIYGGITRCDEIAEGIVDYFKTNKVKIPVYARLTGTNEGQAFKILGKAGIHAAHSFKDILRKL